MNLAAIRLAPVLILLAAEPAADAQRAAMASIGPGRIICNASFCELGIADRPGRRVRVIISRLPESDAERLHKCTGVARPCVVTVDGLEQGDQMHIMATGIVWQD